MKDNKLIAEFMGNPTIFNTIHDATLYQVKKQGNMAYHVDELQYHTSWDWLMPVIEKIQDIFVDNPELDWQLYDDIRLNVPYLDDTYNAVLYAIKQYNNQNN